MNTFKTTNACIIQGYLSGYCESLFEKYNYKEKCLLEDMPERMVFETEIWMVGEQLRQEIAKTKKYRINQLLIKEILIVIQTVKYRRGRESFVMLLHYFKKENDLIEKILSSLLDDEQLYAFAIGELTKLKLFSYTDKVQVILSKEKISWKKKEAQKYIEKSKNR
ncbi:hypothetical protein [Capnocytophaga sp. G2]|uniref:hypothetical protein n=1 Tax=Capnocytophaga sp. G2 TaxID=3110695 RepID=UPI002B4A81F3|nr:hypothetical protein [Capnocytophaga sp. G2]MEB3005247.1 hypothetical protein [Capnocytophaga sp. G2]